MKQKIITKLAVAGLAFSLMSSGFASSLSSITSNANNYVINSINNSLFAVVVAWTALTNFYSQNSSFPAAAVYAVNTTFMPGVSSITNSASGTLEIRFGPTAPGPLANNGFALAPTRVTLRGNTFYVYALTQCFTNVPDSMTDAAAPLPGTPSALFGNSNLGTNCLYAADPYSAAVNQVQGSGTP